MGMITRLDRIQLGVRDRRGCAARWKRLFDAATVGEDRVPSLGARRTTLRVGESELEILEADGLGVTAQHVSRAPTPILAVGLAVGDLDAARVGLDARAIHHQVDHDQVWLSGEWLGVPGLRVVLTQDEAKEPAGLLARFYEVTHLVDGTARAAERLATVFELDRSALVAIESEHDGFRGTLTRFDGERPDHIKSVDPFDSEKPMGHFFERRGPCFYSVYAECATMRALRVRLDAALPDLWVGDREAAAPAQVFLPPRALDGMRLGISRESTAWGWGGDPVRAR